jgi:hypothetical protein
MFRKPDSFTPPDSRHLSRHPREGGDPVFQSVKSGTHDISALEYWIARSSRAMTAEDKSFVVRDFAPRRT